MQPFLYDHPSLSIWLMLVCLNQSITCVSRRSSSGLYRQVRLHRAHVGHPRPTHAGRHRGLWTGGGRRPACATTVSTAASTSTSAGGGGRGSATQAWTLTVAGTAHCGGARWLTGPARPVGRAGWAAATHGHAHHAAHALLHTAHHHHVGMGAARAHLRRVGGTSQSVSHRDLNFKKKISSNF